MKLKHITVNSDKYILLEEYKRLKEDCVAKRNTIHYWKGEVKELDEEVEELKGSLSQEVKLTTALAMDLSKPCKEVKTLKAERDHNIKVAIKKEDQLQKLKECVENRMKESIVTAINNKTEYRIGQKDALCLIYDEIQQLIKELKP